MLTCAQRRIQNELRQYFMDRESDDSVKLEIKNGDMMNLKGVIKGVVGTPYEGGTFELDIKIPEEYPYMPPTIKFLTKIWHPSVNPFDGRTCLKDIDNEVWPVTLSIYKLLLIIQSWMSAIDDKEPIDVEILQLAKENPQLFKETAEYWAVKYAGARKPANRDCARKVEILSRYTLNEDLAIVSLSYNRWVLPSLRQNF